MDPKKPIYADEQSRYDAAEEAPAAVEDSGAEHEANLRRGAWITLSVCACVLAFLGGLWAEADLRSDPRLETIAILDNRIAGQTRDIARLEHELLLARWAIRGTPVWQDCGKQLPPVLVCPSETTLITNCFRLDPGERLILEPSLFCKETR